VTHDHPVSTGIEFVRPATLAGTAPYAYAVVTDPGRMAADRRDLVAAWDVVRVAFGGHDAPSTLVGVTVVGSPDQLVEVEAVAVRDSWQEPAPPHDGPTVDG